VLYPYPPQCTGLHVLHSPNGTIEDGSGPIKNYAANASCSWLIDPQVNPEDSIKTINISFNKLNTEAGTDIITIYNGGTTTSPVIGTYSGNTLPPAFQVPGNKVLIVFESNSTVESNGWLISYKSNYPSYCSGNTLTEPSGQISDGSGSKNYNNNTSCTWVIEPPNAAGVKMHFESFDLEQVNDFLECYELGTKNFLSSKFRNTLPPDLIAGSGKMYLIFKTNNKVPHQGWLASYTVTNLSIDETDAANSIQCYPNPAGEYLYFERLSGKPENIDLKIVSLSGQVLREHQFRTGVGFHKEIIRTTGLSNGVCYLRIQTDSLVETRKIIIQHP